MADLSNICDQTHLLSFSYPDCVLSFDLPFWYGSGYRPMYGRGRRASAELSLSQNQPGTDMMPLAHLFPIALSPKE